MRRFAVNRLAIAVVYLWVGAYSMGGPIQESETWRTIGKVTGIVSWVVGVADILMSCCSDRSEKPEITTPASAKFACSAAPVADDAEDPPDVNPFAAGDAGDQPVTVGNPSAAANLPPGGWAAVGSKPFGAG
uniref:Uncharacterized protein n=1 Tax=Alexandrium catenella TaxID=2925 RepID=A0A7S1WSR0_ALECA